jgi:hypothetical protein
VSLGYVVLWDGTDRRPWGRYLLTLSEAEHAAAQRPYRMLRELQRREVDEILREAVWCPTAEIARSHHLHPGTVEQIVFASYVWMLSVQ